MNKLNWRIGIGVLLIGLSALFYSVSYLIFRDARQIFFYLLEDLGFIFIEVLLVTLIIDQLLQRREKAFLLIKLNMIIGVFFSEVGSQLIRILIQYDPQVERLRQELIGKEGWSRRSLIETLRTIGNFDYKMVVPESGLETLHAFMRENKDFFIRMLENPNLIEHDRFTDALWAVVHLAEELNFRKSLRNLPKSDHAHLTGDIERVYKSLITQWIAYMMRLRTDYPYLFSLAIRINPFDPDANPEVTQ
jgi:hypothetical protein